MKRFLISSLFVAQISFACPSGQHEECAIPRPWGGCAQRVCVPNLKNPFDAFIEALQNQANKLAEAGRDSEQYANREDCVVVVAAGLAIWGTTYGGPYGGIAAGAAGAAAARIACRKAFPVE